MSGAAIRLVALVPSAHASWTLHERKGHKQHSIPEIFVSNHLHGMNANTIIRQLRQTSRQALRHYQIPFRTKQPHLFTQRTLHNRPLLLSRQRKQQPASIVANQLRRESTEALYKPPTDSTTVSDSTANAESEAIATRKAQEPAYELVSIARPFPLCTQLAI